MGLEQRGAGRACLVLLAAIASACSGGGSSTSTPELGRGGESPANAAAGAGTSAGGAAAGTASTSPSPASGGTAGLTAGADSGPGGAAGEPPLSVSPVATWGGKPLNMVPYASSGTRLTVVGYADDGAVFFKTMRDTQLGIDCAFEQTAAGDWLCSPKAKRMLIYLDAACTIPASEEAPFVDDTGILFGAPGSVATSGGDDTVLLRQHLSVYRVAERVFESKASEFAEYSMDLYTGSPQKCIGPRAADWHVITSPPSIYKVTPVDDSKLVKATVRHIPLNDGLSLERLVTDDGAQLSGPLTLAGKECELQRDGHCVTAPVAYAGDYADPDCQEYGFRLPSGAKPGVPFYGVEPTRDDTSRIYELATSTIYYRQKTRVDTVTKDGQTMSVVVVEGCEAHDLSNTGAVYYRRSREVTDQIPKLSTVQLGSANLFPSWFFGVVPGTDTRVQVQIHSPDGNWVRPNMRISNGSVCAVYGDPADLCKVKEGTGSVSVTEVNL